MIKLKWFFLALMCLIIISGCSSSKKAERQIAHFNLGDEPHTLDPRKARDPSSQMLLRMFFDGLTRIGPDDQPQLALAKSVDISKDLKTYTFKLRKTYWSNGEPVLASDFVHAWKSELHPDFPADNAYQLYVIKNAKSFKEGKCSDDELGIAAVADDVLIVELEHPTPYFLELVAAPFFFPVHQKTDEANSRWPEKQETYVSNGPFCLDSWNHHDQISVRKNSGYWDASKVSLEGMDLYMVENDTALHMFEKGGLHWTGSPVGVIPVDAIAHLREKGGIASKPRAETAFLRANVEVKALRSPKVRKALALAIDRGAIVEHILQAGQLPAMGLIPPSMQLSESPYFEDHASDKAIALLEEALEDSPLQRKDLNELVLTYINSERSHLIAQAIQQQWNKVLGIRIKLQAIERKVYFDQISRKSYDLAFCSWGADFHDPLNFLEVFKYRYQSTNNTNWENDQYIQLLDSSSLIPDRNERLTTLKKCETILMEEMPIIPLFYYSMMYLQDHRLDGVVLTALGNLDFKWAHLNNED